MNLYGYAGADPVNNSDPFGLCPECPQGLESLREALEQVVQAIKSVPSQLVEFAKDETKGGFVAELATVPLTAAAVAATGEAGSAVAGAATGALVRAQVTALNNPVKAFAVGAGLGYIGVPAPQGFGKAMEYGEKVGKAAKKVEKLADYVQLVLP